MDNSKKIRIAQAFAADKPKSGFTTTFVDSLDTWMNHHPLSEKQERALDNVMKKWNLLKWYEKHPKAVQ